MKGKICPGKAEPVYIKVDALKLRKIFSEPGADPWQNRHSVKGIKRIKIQCEICGARVQSSIRNCHDGCCVMHVIPPHKPKFWWKKKKEA